MQLEKIEPAKDRELPSASKRTKNKIKSQGKPAD